MLSRKQFVDHFKTLDSRIDGNNPDCPLWIPEHNSEPSSWFVCVAPIGVDRFKWKYYDWCNKTLAGCVCCYSSNTDDKQEWWGFTDQKDIVPWLLKWS
jgi:hypothetical protein